MFTGIVKELGKIQKINKTADGFDLNVSSEHLIKQMEVDDSVSINGCCQTVTKISDNSFMVNVVKSTIKKTNFSKLKIGDRLNLELALRPMDRLGGHLVQGHVNDTARVLKINKIKNSYNVLFEIENRDCDLILDEGSIAIDGVSLTVNKVVDQNQFDVYIIPHTWENTSFKYLSLGKIVNLEFDVIGQYVKKFLVTNKYKNEKVEMKIKDFLMR